MDSSPVTVRVIVVVFGTILHTVYGSPGERVEQFELSRAACEGPIVADGVQFPLEGSELDVDKVYG